MGIASFNAQDLFRWARALWLDTWAKGTRANSACSPSNGPLLSGPPKNAVPAAAPLGLA